MREISGGCLYTGEGILVFVLEGKLTAQTEFPELDWAETRLAATTATIATFIVVEYVRVRCDINKRDEMEAAKSGVIAESRVVVTADGEQEGVEESGQASC